MANILSLFDGMSCGMLAMMGAGVEVENYYAYEIDKYAIQTSQHNFPKIKQCGDVFKGDYTQYEGIDYLIGGSPCVPADTKIKTDKGYKKIVDIQIGDMVLTHLNRYMPVSRLYKRKTEHLYNIKFNGNQVLKITDNHPVYVYRNNKFEFVRTDQLTINDYVCVNINQKTNKLEYSDDILWLAGRAIADGYLSKDKNKVVISVGKNKILEFEQHLSNISYYILHKDRAAPEYCINSQELTEFYAYFGNRKALDKYIPDEILNLPKQSLKKIYDGYISGDGFLRKDRPNTVMWCSSSEDLILSMGLLTAKLFGKYPTTTIREGGYKQLPSGMCHTNKSYNSQISITNRLNPDCKIIEDKLLLRIKSIDKNSINTDVYNIEVAKDHSYTVNNVIVHNCTHWSIAQSPDKRETTASGLGWNLFSQYVRALREAKPKYFIYENNKSMSKEIRKAITQTFGFEDICINSALVSAQNRQRLYWVGKRNADGTYSKVDVEQPEDRGILLRDVLDGVTDREKGRCVIASTGRTTEREYFKKNQGNMSFEPVGTTKDGKSYCLTQGYSNGSGENIGNYVTHTLEKGCKSMVAEPVACRCRGRTDKNGNGYAKYECRDDCKSNTLDTNSTNGNMVAEPVLCFILPREDGVQTQSKQYRVYNIDGKTTTLCAEGGGMGAKTGLYAIPIEFDGDIPVKAISAADGKTYTVYEVKDGNITIKGKTYLIKLVDGYYIIRKLTVSECKRLQTVPEWYEFPVSDTQAYRQLGAGWTVDVIVHLIKATL